MYYNFVVLFSSLQSSVFSVMLSILTKVIAMILNAVTTTIKLNRATKMSSQMIRQTKNKPTVEFDSLPLYLEAKLKVRVPVMSRNLKLDI